MSERTLEKRDNQSLVWSRDTGNKVIIVIDDYFKDALVARPRGLFGVGLYTLWRELSEWEETRAIGFFYLPENKNRLRATINRIVNWIKAFDEGCQYYIVLDVYVGNMEIPSSLDLAELLIKNTDERLKKARLTFLSAEGWPGDMTHQKYPDIPVFEKPDFREKIPRYFWQWIGRSSSLEDRIWPAQTKDWFGIDDLLNQVPHRWTTLSDIERRNGCREAFRKYLTNLLSFSPPEEWFSEQQFQCLFADLMHLVGYCCRAQSQDNGRGNLSSGNGANADRNLTLGNVVLLLAAATGNCSANWIKNIRWDEDLVRSQILPSGQTREQARAAILSLADGLFPPLARHDQTGEPLVDRVSLTKEALTIKLMFNCAVSMKEGRLSLFDKLLAPNNNYGGQVYLAINNFKYASSISGNAIDAKCVLNLIPGSNPPDVTYLEIRRCQ